MKPLEELTFGIIGLGLIGGSYAKALKNLKVKNIIGLDTNRVVTMMALDEGYITEGCLDTPEPLRQADVIISTLYPGVLVDFVRRHVQYFKEGVLFTDVTGVKSDLLTKVDALLDGHGDFVSGHPMAGREGKGYGQSSGEIFNNSNYLIIKRDCNDPANVEWMREFALRLGCRHVVEVTPEEHDTVIAYTSDLPHVMAVALMNCDSLQENTKYFIGGGFRDATRVADINAALWVDLFLHNRDKVIREIDGLVEQLEIWKKCLETEDGQEMVRMMEVATARRKELLHGGKLH